MFIIQIFIFILRKVDVHVFLNNYKKNVKNNIGMVNKSQSLVCVIVNLFISQRFEADSTRACDKSLCELSVIILFMYFYSFVALKMKQ